MTDRTPEAPRVLIVDDDAVDRMAVVRALRKSGQPIEVEETDSRAQALRLLEARRFDCVFLDYFLPDGSGLEIVRDARASGVRVPIVILTGQGDEEIAVELMKAGATDYLPKGGATPDRIAQCLRNALRLYEAERTADLAERERSRLLLLEREARDEAEAAQRRLAFLAEASALVSSSLEYEATLENVARLAVPVLADWCFVDLALPDGGFERVAVAHEDASLTKQAERFRRVYPALPDAPHGITRVILSGTPEVTTDTPDWILVSVARDAEHLALLRELGIRSTMCVPLIARGRTLGAITFLATAGDRRYSMADLSFAEEIARRAALAVDNARLYQDAVAAEEQARRQLGFTTAITASLAEGVCAVDVDGAITFANPAAEAMLAWPRGELVGQRIHAHVHLQRADGTRFDAEHSELMSCIREGRVYRSEEDAFTRRDGTTFAVSYASSPLLADGKPLGAVVVFHDISERRLAEERLRFQANLLDAVSQGVVVTDVEGHVTYWNRAAERLHGWSAREAVAQPLLDLIVPERERMRIARVIAQLQGGGQWSGELALRRRGGAEFVAAVSNVPLRDPSGRVIGVIGVIEDITERKRAEMELEESRRQMALSEKLSALGTIVSGVAHEIRTPLTYLANNIFLAQTRLESLPADARKDAPVEDAQRFMTSALEGVDRINTLVKDLRAYVMPEGGRRLETGLHEVVGGAVDLFRATQRGRITLETDLQPTEPLHVDKGQIQRVVINLLVNAAEAMLPRGGRIWVSTRRAPGGAEVVVRDEGCGLAPDIEARIFDPFFTTKPDGTGLGLSITRRIVEAHGGTIRYDTRVDQGTTFRVYLPQAPTAGTRAHVAGRAPAAPDAAAERSAGPRTASMG